jgi:hypothetical protein
MLSSWRRPARTCASAAAAPPADGRLPPPGCPDETGLAAAQVQALGHRHGPEGQPGPARGGAGRGGRCTAHACFVSACSGPCCPTWAGPLRRSRPSRRSARPPRARLSPGRVGERWVGRELGLGPSQGVRFGGGFRGSEAPGEAPGQQGPQLRRGYADLCPTLCVSPHLVYCTST